MDFGKFAEFGLTGLMVGSIIAILLLLINKVCKTLDSILVQAAKERECWIASIQSVNSTLSRHDEKADVRANYNREEHKKIVEILDEQTKALGRINGYKE